MAKRAVKRVVKQEPDCVLCELISMGAPRKCSRCRYAELVAENAELKAKLEALLADSNARAA